MPNRLCRKWVHSTEYVPALRGVSVISTVCFEPTSIAPPAGAIEPAGKLLAAKNLGALKSWPPLLWFTRRSRIGSPARSVMWSGLKAKSVRRIVRVPGVSVAGAVNRADGAVGAGAHPATVNTKASVAINGTLPANCRSRRASTDVCTSADGRSRNAVPDAASGVGWTSSVMMHLRSVASEVLLADRSPKAASTLMVDREARRCPCQRAPRPMSCALLILERVPRVSDVAAFRPHTGAASVIPAKAGT